jgi:hypothetical protein
MLLLVEQLQCGENVRNYPVEIIKQLEDLLLAGGLVLPDPKRKNFYDLGNHERTFFIHISSITGRATLVATWLRPAYPVDRPVSSGADLRCTA